MATTNDRTLAETIESMRNHGASLSEEQRHQGSRPYVLPEFNLLGYNYRMTDLQAAVGLVQLTKLGRFLGERRYWAQFYEDALSGMDWLRPPAHSEDDGHGWQAYVCYVDERKSPLPRNQIMDVLLSKGISTRPGTHAVHILGFYRKKFGLRPDDFPGARDCDRYSLAIPLHNRMGAEDYEYVVNTLKELG